MKMTENPGTGGFNTGKVNNLSYQSEGFPLGDILSLRPLGDGLGQKNCRRVAAAVSVNSLSASFIKEKLHKMMFL